LQFIFMSDMVHFRIRLAGTGILHAKPRLITLFTIGRLPEGADGCGTDCGDRHGTGFTGANRIIKTAEALFAGWLP
jgi:hypothetical protein